MSGFGGYAMPRSIRGALMMQYSVFTRRVALTLLGGAAVLPLGLQALGAEGESARLAKVFQDSDEEQLRLVPQSATGRGDFRYADQFGDLITDDYQRAFEAYARRDLTRIAGVNRSKLSPVEQLEYDVFRYQTEFAIHAYETGAAQTNTQDFALDHLNGSHITFPQFMSSQGSFPYRTASDYENALKMHEGFVVFLDRAREYMARGMKRGNVHPRIVAERIIGQLRDALTAGVDGSPLLTPTANFPAAVVAADRARLTGAFRQSIETRVLPAYRTLLTFFEHDYLPGSRTSIPGLAALPKGPALYAYFLELFTTTRLGAEEIHTTGLAEVARITAEMERVKARVGFEGTLSSFFAYLKADPKFKFATREAYLARFQAIWDRVRPLLPRYFAKLPTLPFEIRPVPPEIETSTGGAYYIGGTPDGSRPGVFYANTSNLPTRTSPIMTALFLHEAQPGHHFQGARAMQDETLPAFLRFLWNSGYVEGWALYCERLGIEMGVYDDPFQYFGMLDMEMFRATRLVIDTGLHAKGWSRDQAIDYMATHTSLDRETIVLEVDRYIVTPGQATSYKVGEIVIRKLRTQAEKALGSRFDLRAFHEQVLNTGSIPLHVLEDKIGRWIAGGGG